ncbi:helix-turn-helix domain-containing protein [Embleya hyalina]|uniref:Transcriptional regulator n=1 Tax=Embleya hyalina TaxID=516124 RepID=A0A401Z6J7_9ACTN|nr:helix-turn-helix transcriptional regulator [Embleya hyalina]GCE02487.1 transcriptional regulator [Embleya hyalina]
MNGYIETAAPALCRLQLATELRRLRQEAGFNSSQVVRRLRWSPSKLTRLEFGDNSIVEPDDVTALCAIYGTGAETRARLAGFAMVTRTREDAWPFADYQPIMRPRIAALSGQEALAGISRSFEGQWIPGLLQTENYIRSIHEVATERFSPEEIERVISVRLARSHVLHRTDAPLKLFQVLDEPVLRRRVGSAAVTREQLLHIAEMTSLPNVRLQVIPFEAGPHTGMTGAFTVFQFPQSTGMRSIVYKESLIESWVVRRDDEVELYNTAFAELQGIALSPSKSLDMIHRAVKELDEHP